MRKLAERAEADRREANHWVAERRRAEELAESESARRVAAQEQLAARQAAEESRALRDEVSSLQDALARSQNAHNRACYACGLGKATPRSKASPPCHACGLGSLPLTPSPRGGPSGGRLTAGQEAHAASRARGLEPMAIAGSPRSGAPPAATSPKVRFVDRGSRALEAADGVARRRGGGAFPSSGGPSGGEQHQPPWLSVLHAPDGPEQGRSARAASASVERL